MFKRLFQIYMYFIFFINFCLDKKVPCPRWFGCNLCSTTVTFNSVHCVHLWWTRHTDRKFKKLKKKLNWEINRNIKRWYMKSFLTEVLGCNNGVVICRFTDKQLNYCALMFPGNWCWRNARNIWWWTYFQFTKCFRS